MNTNPDYREPTGQGQWPSSPNLVQPIYGAEPDQLPAVGGSETEAAHAGQSHSSQFHAGDQWIWDPSMEVYGMDREIGEDHGSNMGRVTLAGDLSVEAGSIAPPNPDFLGGNPAPSIQSYVQGFDERFQHASQDAYHQVPHQWQPSSTHHGYPPSYTPSILVHTPDAGEPGLAADARPLLGDHSQPQALPTFESVTTDPSMRSFPASDNRSSISDLSSSGRRRVAISRIQSSPSSRRSHRQASVFSCSQSGCNRTSSTRKDIKRHEGSVHGLCTEYWGCLCGKTFSRKDSFDRHYPKCSKPRVAEAFSCRCGLEFLDDQRGELRAHIERCGNRPAGRPRKFL